MHDTDSDESDSSSGDSSDFGSSDDEGVVAPHGVEDEQVDDKIDEEDDEEERDRKSTRLNSSHSGESRMPSSA